MSIDSLILESYSLILINILLWGEMFIVGWVVYMCTGVARGYMGILYFLVNFTVNLKLLGEMKLIN